MSKKIMCVDDSPTIRMLVKKALSGKDFEVLEAENGKEALEKVEGQNVSLFVVDVNMPVMDGFTFVKNLRADSRFKETATVFLTTESSEDKKQIGKELGVKGWIVKPFEPASFVKIVEMFT